MKAAFLIRCSSTDQDYERQVYDLTRLAQKEGYEYSEEIMYGEKVSGKDDATIKDRESIARLKEDAKIGGKFDIVLVSEVSRMSRDSASGRWYVRELINWGVPVYFKDIDTWTFEPGTTPILSKIREKEQIIGAAFDAAWKYLKSMKTQIASGRRNELYNNCISVGKPFFGYRRFGGKDKATKNRIVEDEVTAPIVPEIFKEYLKEGATLKSTALAITARYGEALGKKFSVGGINHILCYESYATGIIIFTLNDPDTEEKDVFEIKIPTLIDKELYDAVKTKRNGNRVASEPYPSQTTYLLSKLIKCPCCGYTMTPRAKGNESKAVAELGKYRLINGKKAMSWICMSGINNITDCKNRMSIGNEKIEPIIWELVKMELIGFSKINSEDKKAKLAEVEDKINELTNRIGYYTDDITSQKNLIARAYRAYTTAPEAIADITLEEYHNTASKATKDIQADENKVKGLKDDLDKQKILKEYYSAPSLPADIIDRAEKDSALMRKMVKELITKIVPYKITTFKKRRREKGKEVNKPYASADIVTLKYGVVLLEVITINGTYYVFYNANGKSNTRYAYYLSADVVYTGSAEATEYVKSLGDELFYISSPYLYYSDERAEELDRVIDINEFVEIAKANNQIITYQYIPDENNQNK